MILVSATPSRLDRRVQPLPHMPSRDEYLDGIVRALERNARTTSARLDRALRLSAPKNASSTSSPSPTCTPTCPRTRAVRAYVDKHFSVDDVTVRKGMRRVARSSSRGTWERRRDAWRRSLSTTRSTSCVIFRRGITSCGARGECGRGVKRVRVVIPGRTRTIPSGKCGD